MLPSVSELKSALIFHDNAFQQDDHYFFFTTVLGVTEKEHRLYKAYIPSYY